MGSFPEGYQLQPRDAHSLLRGHQFRQDQPQQGTVEGPHEEEKGKEHGEDQVRGALQERQEQVVLPEAEVLETSILKTVVLTLVHILSVCLVALFIPGLI